MDIIMTVNQEAILKKMKELKRLINSSFFLTIKDKEFFDNDLNRIKDNISLLEFYSNDKTTIVKSLPHRCTKGCGLLVTDEKSLDELFSKNLSPNGNYYYRGDCRECRNNREKDRIAKMAERNKKLRSMKSPEKYNFCLSCEDIQHKIYKSCRKCGGTSFKGIK